MPACPTCHRRQFLRRALAGSAALFTAPGLLAEQLPTTATMAEGPFYPTQLPLDTDNDLLIINDGLTPAIGEITHLSGRILTASGQPVRSAFVEIWQVDSHGVYLHAGSKGHEERDSHFQGYGRFMTGSDGSYYFRTIKPVRYPGRTPHIHFGVSKSGKRIFTTQMLIKGDPGNAKDNLLKRITEPGARDTILVDFKPIPGSKLGELEARFDIILGLTVEELDDGTLGGIGASELSQRKGRRPGA